MKTTFKYDHYYKYAELQANLEFFASNYPELCELSVNCLTAEGRNQYAVTLTNKKTGAALAKPALYIDGNIHAGEVTSSMCAMHTIDYLLTNYGSDPECQKLLDSYTVYVIPRVSPDGAETYLSTPYTLRSVNKDYIVEKGGVAQTDLDGDGVIRMMRFKTPYGAWKKDPNDPSKVILRDASDCEGEFYDIYTEGMLEEYAGQENLKTKRNPWGLDFNRNFPYGWFPESRQPGAGKYPLSNPECKALCDFVLDHPNIGGAAIGHTSGGIILYPPGTRPSTAVSAYDIKVLKNIAKMGQEELGYEPLNIFDSFMDDQTNYDSGAFDDWCYQTQGIPAYTMEFWDINTLAGVPMVWNDKRGNDMAKNVERFNATLDWVKANAPQYYKEWEAFEHPQLGSVEIGGFNYKYTFQNPPENFLLKEVEGDTRFNIRFLKALPKLQIDSVKSEQLGEDLYRVEAIVGNLGYLATNLCDEAKKLQVNKPVTVTIQGAAELLSGQNIEELGDLAGYSSTATGAFFYGNITTSANAKARKKVSWLIKAKAGTTITLVANSAKAGQAIKEITL